MKVEKFKVLLYLKKSGTDKSGKAPIMGRITVNRTMAQFGCKLSCRPDLWNARESRLDGKSREAVETKRARKPSGRQEPRGGGNQRKTGQAAACGQCGVRHAGGARAGL